MDHEQQAQPDSLRDRLQQQCSDWRVYWRASDAHGVGLSTPQAAALLRDALGVEVEIKCLHCLSTADDGEMQRAPVAQPVQTLCGYPSCDCERAPPAPPCPRGLPMSVAFSSDFLTSYMEDEPEYARHHLAKLVAAITSARTAGRREALEEAAHICDICADSGGAADAIRTLPDAQG